MIVVTGGAGFIGSNLVAAIEKRGAVAVCDQLGEGEKWRNIAKRDLAALVAPESLFDFLDGHAPSIEAVAHLGAITATTETNVDLLVRTNIQLSRDLWRWCADHGVRLLYASSAATYGAGEAGFDDDGSVGGLARLFRSHNPDYPDGGQMRDFIWVGDCVDAILWFLDHPGVSGLYNMGTGKARSFADLASAVYRALNRSPQIEYVDTPAEIRDKYQYFTEARMARLRQAGYTRPFTELEDGVGRYVRDFLAAADPYL